MEMYVYYNLHWDLRIDKMCDKELAKFLELILCIYKQFSEACWVSQWLKMCKKENKYGKKKHS